MAADDMDNILEELSASCYEGSKTQKNVKIDAHGVTNENSVKTEMFTEDLSDILFELKEVKVESRNKQRASSACDAKSKSVQKCLNPLVGGTDITLSEFHAGKICNHLRCLSCDLPVIVIDGFRWHDSVDYIFIRTNYPDVRKLHSRLTACRPNRAYLCQCSYLDASTLASLRDWNNIKWICNGH